MKVLTSEFVGVSQLQTYMKLEERREGWLVVFDARPLHTRTQLPIQIETEDGRIQVVVVDINPVPPSKR
jgi:hypothetical protein